CTARTVQSAECDNAKHFILPFVDPAMKPVSSDLPPRNTVQPPAAPPGSPTPGLLGVHASIISCNRCPRLRGYCELVARDKKRAHREETYWGRPVPGFGDPLAR